MTPIFLNNNYSSYPNDFHYQDHQFLSNNSQASSSSNSLMTNMFLDSTIQGKNGIFGSELHTQQHQHQGDNFGSQAYNHPNENSDERGVEFSTWDKASQNQVKWMSSKMKVMLKWKNSESINLNTSITRSEVTTLEDHKLPNLPNEETDHSSNYTTCSNSNIIIPIRVCSDCNTTKTPLWRSGPRGPKSLCNACGIRQRKARRAMAAAAAENGRVDEFIVAPLKVRKTQHKDQKKPSTNLKKRQDLKKITTNIPPPSTSPSPSVRKNCVEEFLVSLSKNLSFYGVCPQDEKEAAILLMALSCGYDVHET